MQSDEAFQALEAEFDTPAQPIQRQHILSGEFRCASEVISIIQPAAISVASEI